MFFIITSSGFQVPLWHPAVFLLQPSKLAEIKCTVIVNMQPY